MFVRRIIGGEFNGLETKAPYTTFEDTEVVGGGLHRRRRRNEGGSKNHSKYGN